MSLCDLPLFKLSIRTVSGVALSLHFFMKVVSLYKNYYINLVFSLDSLSFAVSTSAPGLRWAEKVFFPMLCAIRVSYCCCNRWPQFSGWKMVQTLSCCSGDSKLKRASWAEIKRWQLHLPSGVSNRLLAAFSSFSAPGSFCCLGSQWFHPGLL